MYSIIIKLVIEMDVGKRITNLRKKKNITQQELAKKLYVTDKTISSWEANRTEPSLEMLINLSEIFDCNMSYLVYGKTRRSDIETEIKIKLSEKEYKELDLFLKENANSKGETKQVDTYYEPSYRKFIHDELDKGLSIQEWLRIGIRGNKTILNYKNWYDNKYCDEYEVEIDDAKNLDKIFHILGIEKLIIVDKMRKKYMYLDKYEISLDYVEKLGYFVEIETKKYDSNPLEEYDNLLKIAKSLNLNLENIDKVGYPYHLLREKIK